MLGKMDINAFDRKVNLRIIDEIRNTEKRSLDDYIERILIPLNEQNPSFCEMLYKDINYLLDGLDNEGDNDLVIEDGDFAMEDGDYKLSGYQTRLHDIITWLHIEFAQKQLSKATTPQEMLAKIQNLGTEYLKKHQFTPEYKLELDKIKESLKIERKNNFDNINFGSNNEKSNTNQVLAKTISNAINKYKND